MTAEMETVDSDRVNGVAGSKKPTLMNPYETDPAKLPKDDPFISKSVHYGRYTPHPADFTPRYLHWHQPDPNTNAHWQEIAQKYCTPEHSLNVPGTRRAFAADSVVIRVDTNAVEGAAGEMYSCANANELSAARKVEESLRDIGVSVPVIYFCGTIEGRNVTVESRIPGVSLEVAWRYLSAQQIALFKNQCRQILQHLKTIDATPDEPSYVCRGLNSQIQPDVDDRERDILFAAKDKDEDLCLTHNDLTPANIIVKDARVVGITGWRQSGYFGRLRAKEVHRFFRRLEPGPQHSADGAGEGTSWADLYDDVYDPRKSTPLAAGHDTSVKAEPTSSTLEQFPASDDLETKSPLDLDGAEDYPTSKKLANLKHGLTSRASSSDRSSPATSIRTGGATKNAASGATKKGTAKKPANKKHKINDLDADSVDGRRSNTPVSRSSKTPGMKKQGSVSVAGSPAPEDKKMPKKKKTKKGGKGSTTAQDGEAEDYEDENEIFCICRRPDNHTWMIGCDGGCEDWFHGKCVNIDPRDADLIDKYICPNCKQQGRGCTTWKPMCRLSECRKPARATRKNPSKYCSDEHGREFMRRQTRHLRLGANRTNGRLDEQLGSRGGVLTAGDLKAVIMGVSSVDEFRKLGDRIISPPPDDDEKEECPMPAKKKLGLDIDATGMTYSPSEAAKIEKLRKRREELLHRKEMLAARSAFVGLLRQRAKSVVEKLKQHDAKGGWKDICGFDSRLSWSDDEFDEWRLSEAGKKALAESTAEALAASYPALTDADGDTDMMSDANGEDEIAFLTRGICTKKRCERHKQWVKVQQQDILFEESSADQDLATCEDEAQSVVEKAALRMWAEKENVPFDL